MSATVREVDDMCSDTSRLKVTISVPKAYDRVGIPHVDPLRVWARGIEGNAVRPVETFREYLGALGLAVHAQPAENTDPAAASFCDEDIAGGCNTYDARCRETFGVEPDLEAFGSLRPRVG